MDASLRADAVEMLQAAATKAKRTGRVQFHPSFVIARDYPGPTPLARLIRGGQGGDVRLKLYLSITMMASGSPYDLRNSPTPQSWARILGLPEQTGPRRVARNLKWLSDEKFVHLERRTAHTPIITLLDPMGTGSKYTLPQSHGRYVGVPVELWTRGWILDLSPRAIALLLVLYELLGGQTAPRYVTYNRRGDYGLSTDTWTRGRNELESHRLIQVGRTPQGDVFDYRRMRNAYWINEDVLTGNEVGSDIAESAAETSPTLRAFTPPVGR